MARLRRYKITLAVTVDLDEHDSPLEWVPGLVLEHLNEADEVEMLEAEDD